MVVFRVFQTCLYSIIINDRACLKKKYLGTMFLAVENEDSWIWFLSRLKECIGDITILAIISNKVNSIEIAILAVFPNAYHKLYCSYFLMNMSKTSTNKREPKFCFGRLKKLIEKSLARLCNALNEDSLTWIDIISYHKWERSCFPMVRYNIMTSNFVDSINSFSKDAQKLPIKMLIDFFRATIQQWWYQRHNVGDIIEYVEKVIGRRIKKSSGFRVNQIDQSRYEVTDQMNNGIVNLQSNICSYGKWQLSVIYLICNAHNFGLYLINNNHNLNPRLGFSLVVRVAYYIL
uniref:MULE transposase domain-containing protein n=1 Tax=Lactuca sativa TaxID=4236 RepID=A0A9R1V4T6_LACSA|nr:hypothetical protein LSAT_V11C700350980 [Lactuca sativa]